MTTQHDYAAGQRYRVIRDGAYLDGWRPLDAHSHRAWNLPLRQGTVLTCQGRSMTMGDGMPVVKWAAANGQWLARDCEFHPGKNLRPDHTYLELLTEESWHRWRVNWGHDWLDGQLYCPHCGSEVFDLGAAHHHSLQYRRWSCATCRGQFWVELRESAVWLTDPTDIFLEENLRVAIESPPLLAGYTDLEVQANPEQAQELEIVARIRGTPRLLVRGTSEEARAFCRALDQAISLARAPSAPGDGVGQPSAEDAPR
jgi:hypothetical protein